MECTVTVFQALSNFRFNERANKLTGFGRAVINGEPQARWLGTVTMVGTRPGVDGIYRIWGADHSYSRQGYEGVVPQRPAR